MTQITITEGLAEIKTIGKRVEKKREFITANIARQDTIKDPLENQGGSKKVIQQERQGIADLYARLVKIRSEISRANSVTSVSINGMTHSIADWIVWRREVAPQAKGLLQGLRQGLASLRQQAQQKGIPVRGIDQQAQAPTDVIVNIDEKALAEEIEGLEDTLGQLDGILSLKNATVLIDV